MTYQQTAMRRGGATPEMTGCRRNPTSTTPWGWADPHRRTALLVACVLVGRVRHAPRALSASRLGPARLREMRDGLYDGADDERQHESIVGDTS